MSPSPRPLPLSPRPWSWFVAAVLPLAGAFRATSGRLWYPPVGYGTRDGPEALCWRSTPLHGTMKSKNKWEAVMRTLEGLVAQRVGGDVVEAGVAEGGGVLPVIFFLACTGELKNRNVYLFDTWEGLSPVSAKDAGFHEGQFHIGFELFSKNVAQYAEEYGKLASSFPAGHPGLPSWDDAWKQVHVVKGLFADTMPGALSSRSLALLMCDGDMYSSTLDCLQSGAPRLAAGGVVYSDDYYTFAESYAATKDYFERRHSSFDAHLVTQDPGEFKLLPETTSKCTPPGTPPTSNTGPAGTCGGAAVEAAIIRETAR